MEQMMEKMMQEQAEFRQDQKMVNQQVADQIRDLDMKVDLLATQGKLLETQVAQQASSSSRQHGQLPPKPDCNPNASVKAITLRSGTAYDGPEVPQDAGVQAHHNQPDFHSKNHVETEQESDKGDTNASMSNQVKGDIPRYVPPHRFIPYPQRLANIKLDKQYAKFIELLKKLNVNIPFIDVVTQMPTYAKFLKDILSNRRKLDDETVTLTEKVSAIVMNKLSPKLQDPGSFTILCSIDSTKFNRVLCDLGASVSLMSKSVFDRIGVSELVPTRISLQLADRSVKYPVGQVEDLPLQVGKFYILIDFVVIEMDEHPDTPLIFDRPFLNTAGTQIDVRGGKLTFEIGKEKVEFDMFKALKYPANDGNFCRVDMIDVIVKEEFEKVSITDSIDKLVSHPSDGEFERFLEQLELDISKSKERRHETAHSAENL
jgi:glutaredoxin-related protein